MVIPLVHSQPPFVIAIALGQLGGGQDIRHLSVVQYDVSVLHGSGTRSTV